MHPESLSIINQFIKRHLSIDNKLKILDVGSYDVNGSYRHLFANPNWEYIGLDIESGPNVDFVSVDEYNFGLPSDSFDIVLSGNTIEHVKDIFSWVKEIARVAVPGGLICITTVTNIDYHPHPVDCWRIMPDGFEYLFNVAGLLTEEIQLVERTVHSDIIAVARKK